MSAKGGSSKKSSSSNTSTPTHPPLQTIKINPNAKPPQEEEKFAPNGAGYIEEQVILRVPPKLASQLREHIKRQQNTYSDFHGPELNFTFEDGARGLLLNFGSEEYVGTLVDLPCITESLKTVDNTNYYKSADISQMILIHDETEEDNPVMNYDSDFKFHHGITPPTKNIRRRRFKKISESRKQDISAVEEEVIKLMKGGSLSEEIEVVEASALNPDEGTPASTPHIEEESLEDMDLTPTPQVFKLDDNSNASQSLKQKKKNQRNRKNQRKRKKEKKKLLNQATAMSPAQVSPQMSPQATSPNPYNNVSTPPPFFNPLPSSAPLSPQVTPSPMNVEAFESNVDQYFAPEDRTPQQGTPATIVDYRNDPAYRELKDKERTLQIEIQSLQAKMQETEEQTRREQNNIIQQRLEKKKQEFLRNLGPKMEQLSIVQQQIRQKEGE